MKKLSIVAFLGLGIRKANESLSQAVHRLRDMLGVEQLKPADRFDAIVHLLLNLMRDPERLELLHDRPELAAPAVEELLRVSQSAGGGLGSGDVFRPHPLLHGGIPTPTLD